MRETHFNKERNEYTCDYFHDENAGHKAIQKLGRLEDIEELCERVVSQPIYEKYEDTGEVHKEDYTECRALFSFEYNRIELYLCDFVMYFEPDQYGITWAFTERELESPKPTEKQLDFIKRICDELKLDDPKPKTKGEASRFISEHCDEFHKRVQWMYQSDWAIANGYF